MPLAYGPMPNFIRKKTMINENSTGSKVYPFWLHICGGGGFLVFKLANSSQYTDSEE